MFNKNNSDNNMEPKGNIETVIGPSVKVDGNFAGSGDVNVEGSVVGSLKTSKNLRIGESAKVKADVKAENIHLAGEIKGNVVCKGKLELTSTGRIIGNIETQTLSVQSGATFNGKCQMLDQDSKDEEVPAVIVEQSNGEKKGKHNRK
ncbi:polymer-forming cytoskeletal protein [Patescibacteria group bacterium]